MNFRKWLFVLNIAILTAGGSAHAADYSQTFKAQNVSDVEISVNVGNVQITPWERDEIVVTADEVEPGNFDAIFAGKVLRVSGEVHGSIAIKVPSRLNIEASTSAGEIFYDGNSRGKLNLQTSAGDITVGDVVQPLELSTSGGDITVGNVNADATLETSGGSIDIQTVAGALNAHTSGGDITFGNIGKNLNARSGGGNITGKNVGGSANIATGGGDVTLGSVNAEVTVSTGGGNIEVQKFFGNSSFETGGGDVILNSGKGDVNVRTGGGSVYVTDFSGSIEGRTSGGDIQAELVPNGSRKNTLKTNGGSIELYVPANAKATIDAVINVRGRWDVNHDSYEIYSDFNPINFEKDESKRQIRSQYQVNGGGVAIYLETTEGEITIRRGNMKKQ